MTSRVSGSLEVRNGRIHCGKCDHDLAPADGSWKNGALVRHRPMNNAGGVSYKSREHVLLRLFFCPGCGRQLATETAMKDDPYLEDVLKAG